MPTQEQDSKITELKLKGYKWNKQLTVSYAAVVMQKDKDLWVFTLDGGILQNPTTHGILQTIKWFNNKQL